MATTAIGEVLLIPKGYVKGGQIQTFFAKIRLLLYCIFAQAKQLILKRYSSFFFILFSTLTLQAQDFEDLPGVDAIYFDDIKSIEYRTLSNEDNNDPTAQIGALNEEISNLKKRRLVEDNTDKQEAIQDDIIIKQRKLNSVYSTKSERDQWNLRYSYPLSALPIINLGTNQSIYFAFDDLNEEPTYYSYTVIPFSWDWSTPLDLASSEYLDGFSSSEIRNFVYPELTVTNYTAHRFHFPNNEITPTISGNYLLIVYETNSEEVAFTRRIFVARQEFSFVDDIRSNSFDRDSLQNINFTVSYPEKYNKLAPDRDVKVVVCQNGRYDNAIIKEKPALAMNDRLRYGYQDKVAFQPGKEFRYIMMQTLDYAQVGTELVNQNKDNYEVYLAPQEERVYRPNLFYRDLNGKFVTMNGVQNEELGDPDYAHVYFTYYRDNPYYQADLYVVGKFTDWQFQDEYRLSFNNRVGRYEGEGFLKQGYYDYYYALKKKGSNQLNIDKTEGHSFQTANEYTILVYYTTPNGRFEKLVAAKTLSVNR